MILTTKNTIYLNSINKPVISFLQKLTKPKNKNNEESCFNIQSSP